MEAAAIDELRERFYTLWASGSFRSIDDASEAHESEVFDALLVELNDSKRYYHSLEHVADCLHEFEFIKRKLNNAAAVECAIWFHDYIIDPLADDEESRSAAAFEQLAQKRFDDATIEQTTGLILASTHARAPIGNDQLFFVDIDLSAIGAPWEKFSFDSKNIRKESSHLSSEEYYRNNSGFLKKLYDRPRIFNTDFFFEKFEAQARSNISRQIEALVKQGLLDQ